MPRTNVEFKFSGSLLATGSGFEGHDAVVTISVSNGAKITYDVDGSSASGYSEKSVDLSFSDTVKRGYFKSSVKDGKDVGELYSSNDANATAGVDFSIVSDEFVIDLNEGSKTDDNNKKKATLKIDGKLEAIVGDESDDVKFIISDSSYTLTLVDASTSA